jgi:hypothetical protein
VYSIWYYYLFALGIETGEIPLAEEMETGETRRIEDRYRIEDSCNSCKTTRGKYLHSWQLWRDIPTKKQNSRPFLNKGEFF